MGKGELGGWEIEKQPWEEILVGAQYASLRVSSKHLPFLFLYAAF